MQEVGVDDGLEAQLRLAAGGLAWGERNFVKNRRGMRMPVLWAKLKHISTHGSDKHGLRNSHVLAAR